MLAGGGGDGGGGPPALGRSRIFGRATESSVEAGPGAGALAAAASMDADGSAGVEGAEGSDAGAEGVSAINRGLRRSFGTSSLMPASLAANCHVETQI